MGLGGHHPPRIQTVGHRRNWWKPVRPQNKVSQRKPQISRNNLDSWPGTRRTHKSGRIILYPVENRSTETLMLIIKKHVEVGSTIYRDRWVSYAQLRLQALQCPSLRGLYEKVQECPNRRNCKCRHKLCGGKLVRCQSPLQTNSWNKYCELLISYFRDSVE